MVQLRRLFALLLITLCVALVANAQSNPQYTRDGNTFILSTGERTRANNTIETTFKIKDTDGREYTVYCSKSSGACFIKKTSRNGNEYKKYLGEEISRQICTELNIEYKPRTRR